MLSALVSGWDLTLKPFLRGRGELQADDNIIRLTTHQASASGYSDAQLDDYQDLPRRAFPWSPPLHLSLTVRFSHNADRLRGTAGFGFWNDPFMMTGARPPALPRAAWFFFASPPSDMKLDFASPGCGWKAATIDTTRLRALAWAPLAPLLVPVMNLPGLYRRLWPPVQRSLSIREAPLNIDMRDWHDYRLDWSPQRCRFLLDNQLVLEAPSLRGRMGFVLWLDNQYMVARPWGHFAWGLLDVPDVQWMEVRRLSIDRTASTASTATTG